MKMEPGHILKLKEEFQEANGGQHMWPEIKFQAKFRCILLKAIMMIMVKN